MGRLLRAVLLACFLTFGFVVSAFSGTDKNQTGKESVFYEQVLLEEAISAKKVSARHERRISQNKSFSEYGDFLSFYSEAKKMAEDKLGLQFGIDVSFMAQRAAPNGKNTAIQAIYYPYATWNLFKSERWGSGQIDFNYTLTRYWGGEAAALNNRVNVVAGINDGLSDGDTFSQATYTHTMPGKLSWLSLTVGQYPLYNFDGTTYDSNPQTALINYALAQNASASYPAASLGAYLQAALNEKIILSAGYQDATNISGSQIRFKDAFPGEYTAFASLSYADNSAQYSAMAYYQPSVEDQEGYSWGWSLNAERDLGKKWNIFGRANGSSDNITSIKQSYVLGLSFLNPLERNPLDVITIAAAYNRLSEDALLLPYVRSAETVIEAQWVWGISKYFTLTPDIQLYPRAGLSSEQEWVSVASLRTTFMF